MFAQKFKFSCKILLIFNPFCPQHDVICQKYVVCYSLTITNVNILQKVDLTAFGALNLCRVRDTKN
jgi:hypothetical protein